LASSVFAATLSSVSTYVDFCLEAGEIVTELGDHSGKSNFFSPLAAARLLTILTW
jgi:hypothetical protein